MIQRKTSIRIFAFCVALVFAACTKKNGSNLTLSAPPLTIKKSGVGAMEAATLELEHVAVHITAANLPVPVTYSWDYESGKPLDLNFTLATGSARLIQILAIYHKTGDNGDQPEIYYGDLTKELVSGENMARITLDVINPGGTQPATGTTGRIIGRYINASGSGYTGKILYKYKPAGGKPSMLVHSDEMFNGWFSVFALQGNGYFTYELGDGSTLFNGAVGADSNSILNLTNDSERTARFLYRAHYKDGFEGGQSADRESVPSERYTVGFFGPGAATGTRKVCYNSNSADLNERWEVPTGGNPARWVAANSIDAARAGVEEVASVRGGSASAALCSSEPNLLVNAIRWSHQDSDEGAGFRGPFMLTESETSRGYVTGDYNSISQKLVLSWKLIPGVATTGVDQIHIFNRSSGSQENYEKDEGFDCANLESNYGFQKVGNLASSVTSAEIDMPRAAYNSGNSRVILCPYSVSKSSYYNKGVDWRSGSSNEKIRLAFTSPNHTAPANTCVPYSFELKRNNASVTLPPGLNLTFQLSLMNVSGGSFYGSSTNCSASTFPITTATMTAGSSSKTFYFKTSAAGANQIRLSPNGGGDLFIQEAAVGIVTPNGSSPTKVYTDVVALMAVDGCYPVFVTLADSSGAQAHPSGMGGSIISPAAGILSSDSNCVNGGAVIANTPFTIAIGSGQAAVQFFFRPTTTGVGDFYASFPTLMEFPKSVAVGSSTVDRVEIINANNYTTHNFENINECTEFHAASVNSVGASVAVSNFTSFSISTQGAANGAIYDDPSCLVAVTTIARAIYKDQRMTNRSFFFKKTASPVPYFLYTQILGSGSSFNTELTVTPPASVQFTGMPNAVVTGYCYAVGLQLKDRLFTSYTAKNNIPVAMLIDAAGGSFFVDPACSTALPSSEKVFAAGQTSAVIYMRLMTGANYIVKAILPNGVVNQYPGVGDASRPLYYASSLLGVNMPGTAGCVAATINTSYPLPYATNFSLGFTNGGSYSSFDCSTPGVVTANVSLAAGQMFTTFFVKTTQPATFVTVQAFNPGSTNSPFLLFAGSQTISP